jgi:hypothetical protein
MRRRVERLEDRPEDAGSPVADGSNAIRRECRGWFGRMVPLRTGSARLAGPPDRRQAIEASDPAGRLAPGLDSGMSCGHRLHDRRRRRHGATDVPLSLHVNRGECAGRAHDADPPLPVRGKQAEATGRVLTNR